PPAAGAKTWPSFQWLQISTRQIGSLVSWEAAMTGTGADGGSGPIVAVCTARAISIRIPRWLLSAACDGGVPSGQRSGRKPHKEVRPPCTVTLTLEAFRDRPPTGQTTLVGMRKLASCLLSWRTGLGGAQVSAVWDWSSKQKTRLALLLSFVLGLA